MVAPYRQPTSVEEVRNLWIGGLRDGIDEKYLYECFALTGEVQSVRLIRNRNTGFPEGYGFIQFISHEAAEKALRSYNGARMPGTEHTFRLSWASSICGERRPHEGTAIRPTWISAADPKTSSGSHLQDGAAKGKEAVIPSVGKIDRKIVCDAQERRPHAGSDHSNGGYCSTTPLQISAAIPNTSSESQLQNGAVKAMYPAAAYTIPQAQTSQPDSKLTKNTIFIGNLDPNATEEELRQRCVQFGDLIRVKIPVGKGCGFVQFASMASAKEAIDRLHGTVIGQQVVRLSWSGSLGSKQAEGETGMVPAAEGAYYSTGPMQTSAAISKTSSGSQHQDGASKAMDPLSPPPGLTAELLEVKLGTLSFPVKDLVSLPLRIESVSENPTVLVEIKKKKKKKKKKRKKTTGSASPRKNSLSPSSTSSSTSSSTQSIADSSAPPWGNFVPVWSVPWSGLPCGCQWPISPMDALNVQPTQFGLHHMLPDEPNEILASFKPWLQRFYGYGGRIPCPRDLVPLEAFKEKCPLSEPYVLHNGKEIGVTTSSGRFVLGGLVDDVIDTFKSGFSWGGNFGKDEIAVEIGVRCYVSKEANLQGTYKNLCKDLNQAADALIPHFRGVHTNNIAFIEHLYHTMKNPPPPSSTTQERQRYLKFLKSHPARADPLSVSSLLVGIAQTYKSMGLSDKKAFEAAVKKIESLKFHKWIEKVKSDPLWNTVYTAKEKRRSIIKKKTNKERYKPTAISLSTYLRHFIIHSPEYTLIDGVQQMTTIDEVDYLVADFFDEFIAELFKVLVDDFDMDKDVLKSVWKMYDAGEDRKQIIKRIWKGESKLDFTLKAYQSPSTSGGRAMTD